MNNQISEEIVTLELTDGTIKDCFIIAFPKDEHGSFIALLPNDDYHIDNGKLLLFRYLDDNDIPKIIGIEDDAELEYADGLLSEIINDSEYLNIIRKYKKDLN